MLRHVGGPTLQHLSPTQGALALFKTCAHATRVRFYLWRHVSALQTHINLTASHRITSNRPFVQSALSPSFNRSSQTRTHTHIMHTLCSNTVVTRPGGWMDSCVLLLPRRVRCTQIRATPDSPLREVLMTCRRPASAIKQRLPARRPCKYASCPSCMLATHRLKVFRFSPLSLLSRPFPNLLSNRVVANPPPFI